MQENERVLLVEGVGDLHAVRNLLFKHQVPIHLDGDGTDPLDCMFEIREANGRDNLPEVMDGFLDLSDVETFGVIADADENAETTWQSILKRLHQHLAETTVPRLEVEDRQDGWIGEVRDAFDDPVRVGVWVMPDNERSGALEEFVGRLINENDVLWPHAQEVVETLPERRFRDVDVAKAAMHTWLAWQKPPREPMGRAISASEIPIGHESPLALRFVDWIRRLFDVE